jgi:hypothetical protein
MTTKKIMVGLVFTFCFFALRSQTTKQVKLNVQAIFGEANLILNDSVYSLKDNHTITFESLKFYISNIELLQDNKLVFKKKDSFYLFTADSLNKYITLNVPFKTNFNGVKFNLGIDSLTNVSGAMGQDLDPTKGMYWTWQNGYINFKIEGKSTICNNPKKEFLIHLGGYAQPYNALQTIVLDVKNNKRVNIVYDVKQFVEKIYFTQNHHIMSPSTNAVLCSQIASTCFKTK